MGPAGAEHAGLSVGQYDEGYRVSDCYGSELVELLTASEVIALGQEAKRRCGYLDFCAA